MKFYSHNPLLNVRSLLWGDKRPLHALLPRRQERRTAFAFGLAVMLAEAVVLLGAKLAAIFVSQLLIQSRIEPAAAFSDTHFSMFAGVSIALFLALRFMAGDYALRRHQGTFYALPAVMLAWVSSCAMALVALSLYYAVFPSDGASPFLFGLMGGVLLGGWRAVFKLWFERNYALVRNATRKIFLVGFEEDMESFRAYSAKEKIKMRVVGSAVLRKSPQTAVQREDLALALSVIRFLKPDDVMILLPWGNDAYLEAVVQTLRRAPVSIYMLPAHTLDTLDINTLSAISTLPALKVGTATRKAMPVFLKRAADIVLSALLLLLLVPLFAVVALCILLESKGSVFYTQRRYGFNQEPFMMLKFRSMHHNPGARFQQAVRNDPRITRVGRFIRKWNIDELPQLINVLKGEMSLVGPRPHAIAHDQMYMNRIGDYAHRHNVLPGITGWAQVNGLRGETAHDSAMIRRVEHDIYYINNWSLGLDVWILCLTVFSPRAYTNAG